MSKSVHELLFLVISSLEYEMSKHCAGVTLIRCYFKLNFRNGFFEYFHLKCKTENKFKLSACVMAAEYFLPLNFLT